MHPSHIFTMASPASSLFTTDFFYTRTLEGIQPEVLVGSGEVILPQKEREREREEEVIGGHLTKVNERTDVRSMFVFSSSSHIVSPLLFVTFGFFFPHIFDCFGSPIGVNTERSPHPNKLPDSHRGFSPENPLFFLNIIIMITAQPAPISQLEVYVKLTRTWEATLPVFSSSSSHSDYGNVQTFLFVLLSTLPKEKQQNKKLT